MKRLFIFLASTLFVLTMAKASQVELFQVNADGIYTEMTDLFQLETYVAATNQTYNDLQLQESSLIANLAVSEGMSGMYLLDGPPLGIPSFFWGFCLGVPGLAVVYFVTEDKDETKKALWGCVASAALYTVFYVVYYAIWVAAVNTAY